MEITLIRISNPTRSHVIRQLTVKAPPRRYGHDGRVTAGGKLRDNMYFRQIFCCSEPILDSNPRGKHNYSDSAFTFKKIGSRWPDVLRTTSSLRLHVFTFSFC